MSKCGIDVKALGLAFGVVWGVSILLMGLLAYYMQYGQAFVSSMGALYWGYEATIMGSIIGGFIGFVDGFIGGAILGFLYNIFAGCRGKKDNITTIK